MLCPVFDTLVGLLSEPLRHSPLLEYIMSENMTHMEIEERANETRFLTHDTVDEPFKVFGGLKFGEWFVFINQFSILLWPFLLCSLPL